jgi:hypothetical protein
LQVVSTVAGGSANVALADGDGDRDRDGDGDRGRDWGGDGDGDKDKDKDRDRDGEADLPEEVVVTDSLASVPGSESQAMRTMAEAKRAAAAAAFMMILEGRAG